MRIPSFARCTFLCLAWTVLVHDGVRAARTNSDPGRRPQVAYQELKAGFRNPDKIHAPFLFWFWDTPLDSPQTRLRMADMARSMCEQGFNPGYVHGRMCMVGLPDLPMEQWLSPLWFDTFEAALKNAEASGAVLGYADEYWWPSGSAADRVLRNHPDLWAVSLAWETFEVRGGDFMRVPESFFTVAARFSPGCSMDSVVLEEQGSARRAAASGMERIPHTQARILSRSIQILGEGGPFSWKAPAGGNWRVYSFSRYYHPGEDGGRVNLLDSRLSEAFIHLAHEPYAERFGPRMGGSIPGALVDHEGDDGYKLAWSETLAIRYREKTGKDIRAWMPLLVDEDDEGRCAAARWAWHDAVSDVYTAFLGGTSRWLAERGMTCVSNLWEENLMWQASAVGDFFKAQRAFTLPGMDALGLSCMNVHDFKETQSVSEFESRRMQSEILGGSGFWGFNTITIKQAANAVAAWGTSHVVPHAVFTTRKLDGNPWLPDWFEEHPMWPYLHLWADFVRRASYVNAHGRTVPDVLLLNPMDSVWGIGGPGEFDPAFKGRVPWPAVSPPRTAADIERTCASLKETSGWWIPPVAEKWFDPRVAQIDSVYRSAMETLTAHRIEYLAADRYYLGRMEARGGKLVLGDFVFRTVVLPPMTLLPLDAARKIVRFAESGGRVYCLGSLPHGSAELGNRDPRMLALMARLRSLPGVKTCVRALEREILEGSPGLESTVRFESGAFPVLSQHRRIDGRDFFWLANNTGSPQTCLVSFPGLRGSASIWDCESGSIRPVPPAFPDTQKDESPQSVRLEHAETWTRVRLTFDEYQAYWVVIDPIEPRSSAYENAGEAEPQVQMLEGPWAIRVDRTVQPILEHPKEPPESLIHGILAPLADWEQWGLKAFSGYVDYTKEIAVSETGGKASLDLGNVKHMAQVWINDQNAGMRLWPPFRFDVTRILSKGKNRIHVRVGNLLNNSYGQASESGLFGPVRLVQVR